MSSEAQQPLAPAIHRAHICMSAVGLQVNYDYFDGRPNSENVGGGAVSVNITSSVRQHLTSSRRWVPILPARASS